MNKKLLIAICIAIILCAIGLVYGSITCVKFLRLNNIYKALDEHVARENYMLTTIATYKDSQTVTKMYYKNGIGKMVAANGIYTWIKDENVYVVDEEAKELNLITDDSFSGVVKKDSFALLVPGYSYNTLGRLVFAGDVNNKISTEKMGGVKYYKIESKDENATKRIWISSTMNYLVKAEIEFPNGEKINYDYSIKFEETLDSQLLLPDITDYTLKSDTGIDLEVKNFLSEE